MIVTVDQAYEVRPFGAYRWYVHNNLNGLGVTETQLGRAGRQVAMFRAVEAAQEAADRLVEELEYQMEMDED